MKRNILESKISIPKLSSEFLYRERIVTKLLDPKKLVLIHANVGHGKTVAMVHLVAQTKEQCAWLHVNHIDNDIAIFVQYLTETIHKSCEAFDFDYVVDVLREELLSEFVNRLFEIEAFIPDGLLIVLDDFQAIENEKIFQFIEYLLQNTSDKIRFMIATRGVLPPFFAKYLLNGMAETITQKELCFTLEETILIVERSLQLDDGQTLGQYIFEGTEGWPAGVMFSIIYLRQQGDYENYKDEFYEKNIVHSYLMHEIYKKLPYDIQQFLSITSALDFLNPSVCNAVMQINNSGSILNYLNQENLFVIKLDSPKSYRYHSLFKDFLNETLRGEKRKDVLNRAAEYYLSTPNKEQALEYAMQSGNTTLVQYALGSLGINMIKQGKIDTLSIWVEYLIQEEVKLTSQTHMIFGIYFYRRGNIQKALTYIDQASDMFLSAMDENGYIGCIIEKAVIVRNTMSLEDSNAVLEGVLPQLRNQNSPLFYRVVKERLYNLIFLDRLEEALGVCSEVILTARRNQDKKNERCFARYSIIIYFYMGKYDKAYKLCKNLSVTEESEAEFLSVSPYVAMLSFLYGDVEEAQKIIEREIQVTRNYGYREDLWINYVFQGGIYALICSHEWMKTGKTNRKLFVKALKAIDTAQMSTGLWGSGHIFTRFIEGMKAALTVWADLEKGTPVTEEKMEYMMKAHPFARDFSICFFLLHYYLQRRELPDMIWQQLETYQVRRTNLFSIYVDTIRALIYYKKNDIEHAKKVATGIQTYMNENHFKMIPLDAEASQILNYLLEGETLIHKEDEKQDDSKLSTLEVHSIGNFEVYLPKEKTPIKWRTKKAQELFAWLFHMQGDAIPRERVLLQLWPDNPEKSAIDLLHSTLYSIRKVLSQCGMDKVIIYKQKRYSLNMEMIHSDIQDLLEVKRRVVQEKDSSQAIFQEVMELYRGEYLEDIDSSFCVGSREVYEREFLELYQEIFQICLQEKKYEMAVTCMTKALEIDTYSENNYLNLMRCYSQMGNVKGIKSTYERMTTVFTEELEMELGESIENAYKQCIFDAGKQRG